MIFRLGRLGDAIAPDLGVIAPSQPMTSAFPSLHRIYAQFLRFRTPASKIREFGLDEDPDRSANFELIRGPPIDKPC